MDARTPSRRTRKRLAAIALAVVAAGVGWYLASPLFVATRSNEAVPSEFTVVVKQGAWQGRDDFHFASGVARILGDGQGAFLLRLEDFRMQNGPDIEFFLSADARYDSEDVGLGNVPATSGSYNVAIPAGTDIASVGFVLVWCVPFGVLFATAALSG